MCSCLQCPQQSELVHFLLWELSMTFFIFHRQRVCLVGPADLIPSLYSWWEGFGSSSLATLPLGFNCGFISSSMWVVHWGLLLRLPWRAWVCPWEGQAWRWCICLGRRGSGRTRYSGGLEARAAGNIALGGYGNPYWPICQYSCLENPTSLTEKTGRLQSTGCKESDTTEAILHA